jgi:glycosyltransferase involved in cell wall biosynthesis
METSMNNTSTPRISVVLPTYQGDTPDELKQAIESLADQTVLPEELYIVKDGPLTNELESVLYEKTNEFPTTIRTHQIDENQGLGNALQIGVKNCSYDIVARMDADDISVPSRFERQLGFLSENPDIDIVGGYIEEFDSDPNNPIARREVPTTHRAIQQMARFRSPMNHGTVMFEREAVLDAGNYRAVDRMEDYDLWIRMLLDGATFANIPEVLLKVRAGEEMYGRRGGWVYAREEIRTQVEFYRQGFISFPICLFNTLTRTTLRLLPSKIRGRIYQLMARG